ncbi:MAG: ferrous iron transport protein A [Anaerolineaceae bacterium]|nr:ferrous iron transport protein A [Anaerolineaceae bacterium]
MDNEMDIALMPKTALQGPAMPLSMVNRGEVVVVKQVKGCRTVRQRLMDLGLNPGAQVQVLKNEISGPLIIAVKGDGRLALGRGMTHHILVMAVPGGKE